jgi:hypothetical protein
MNSSFVMGTAQVSGLVTTVVFDPNAEPSESWRVTVGDKGLGFGSTPELALDGALRGLGPKDVFLMRVAVTVH